MVTKFVSFEKVDFYIIGIDELCQGQASLVAHSGSDVPLMVNNCLVLYPLGTGPIQNDHPYRDLDPWDLASKGRSLYLKPYYLR
jgi:hypothetical protein